MLSGIESIDWFAKVRVEKILREQNTMAKRILTI